MNLPPFRADQMGSLLRPAVLSQARGGGAAGVGLSSGGCRL